MPCSANTKLDTASLRLRILMSVITPKTQLPRSTTAQTAFTLNEPLLYYKIPNMCIQKTAWVYTVHKQQNRQIQRPHPVYHLFRRSISVNDIRGSTPSVGRWLGAAGGLVPNVDTTDDLGDLGLYTLFAGPDGLSPPRLNISLYLEYSTAASSYWPITKSKSPENCFLSSGVRKMRKRCLHCVLETDFASPLSADRPGPRNMARFQSFAESSSTDSCRTLNLSPLACWMTRILQSPPSPVAVQGQALRSINRSEFTVRSR